MKMTDLSKDQLGRITALYRTRGATPDTVQRVATTWHITGTFIGEHSPTP